MDELNKPQERTLEFYCGSSGLGEDIYKVPGENTFYIRRTIGDGVYVRWLRAYRICSFFAPSCPVSDGVTIRVRVKGHPEQTAFTETTFKHGFYEHGIATKQNPFSWEEEQP